MIKYLINNISYQWYHPNTLSNNTSLHIHLYISHASIPRFRNFRGHFPTCSRRLLRKIVRSSRLWNWEDIGISHLFSYMMGKWYEHIYEQIYMKMLWTPHFPMDFPIFPWIFLPPAVKKVWRGSASQARDVLVGTNG